MKKRIALAMSALLCVATCVPFVGCFEEEKSSVSLKGITAQEVGAVNDEIDYYIVPEPAASANVKAKGLVNVGSLQSLYGEANGYPQAVVVAKRSLIESDGKFLSAFVEELAKSNAYLLSDETSVESIIGTVNSHLLPDYNATLNVKNVTKTVIANCGIRYSSAENCKEEVLSFLKKFNAVSEGNNAWGTPSNEFFAYNSELTQTQNESKTSISVFMPDGAPALALANLMANVSTLEGKTVNYTVVDASTISARVNFVDSEKNADICVMPVNAASKLLGNGEKYAMLGTVTHGNLYILARQGAEEITRENISTVLSGKSIGVINLANVPGLTLKVILKDNGISYAEI